MKTRSRVLNKLLRIRQEKQGEKLRNSFDKNPSEIINVLKSQKDKPKTCKIPLDELHQFWELENRSKGPIQTYLFDKEIDSIYTDCKIEEEDLSNMVIDFTVEEITTGIKNLSSIPT